MTSDFEVGNRVQITKGSDIGKTGRLVAPVEFASDSVRGRAIFDGGKPVGRQVSRLWEVKMDTTGETKSFAEDCLELVR